MPSLVVAGKATPAAAPRRRRLRAMVVSASALLAMLAGCGGTNKGGTFFGPAQPLGNGAARTYAVQDADGHPTEVGVRLTTTALDGLPATMDPPLNLMLDLPGQATGTAFDHVMLNWNPHGHDPLPLFAKPHFDFHFDMLDKATMYAIDPGDPNYTAKANHAPEAKYVPQDYLVPPGAPPAVQAVPGMGVHLVDSSDTSLVPGTYDFRQIVINGTWDGRYHFIEPMIANDWLRTKPTLQQTIKLPQGYQKTAYYPTTYAVHFDQQTNEYVVTLGNLTMRAAS
jgi:hypothetical protein